MAYCLPTGLAVVAQQQAPRMAPGVSLYVNQRIFAPGTKECASLSTLNVKTVELSVYATDIETLVPNAGVSYAGDDATNPLSVAHHLRAMTLTKPLRRWSVGVKDFYPDSWRRQQIDLPHLPSGVYILQAQRRGEHQARLVCHFAAGTGGETLAGCGEGLAGARRRAGPRWPICRSRCMMTRDACRRSAPAPMALPPSPRPPRNMLWLASRGEEPAFAHAQIPADEKPFLIYAYCDRPIYRPGQLVRFRGTVRDVQRGVYSLPKAPVGAGADQNTRRCGGV